MTAPPNPIEALFTTLVDVKADAPTACADWTAHELVAGGRRR